MNHISVISVGPYEVNCALVQNPGSDTLYIIDPGEEADRILRAAKSFQFKQAVILLTHAHADHICGIPGVVKRLNVSKVFLRTPDLAIYNSPANKFFPYDPTVLDMPETTWPLNDPEIKVLPCPGHSPGGTSYYFEKLKTVFTGDSLFCCSVGRTDLPGGSMEQLVSSIESQLFVLPDDTRVVPGHGPESSIGFEKQNNPYL